MSNKGSIYTGKLTGLDCPACGQGGQIVRENMSTGEQFLGCTEYPRCKWSSPIPEDMKLRAMGMKGLFD